MAHAILVTGLIAGVADGLGWPFFAALALGALQLAWQVINVRLDDQAGAIVGNELERTAGVDGRHDRFAREERFERHVAVIFVERRVHDCQRVRV